MTALIYAIPAALIILAACVIAVAKGRTLLGHLTDLDGHPTPDETRKETTS